MGTLASLFVLLIVITIHEYGHYLLMKRNGVQVLEFAVGLGPVIFRRKLRDGETFSLRMIPLGGYVMPAKSGSASVVEDKPGWARFKIYMAGMFFNATAAFVVLLGIFYATGRTPEQCTEYSAWAPDMLRLPVDALVLSFGMWLATPAIVLYMIVTKGLAFFNETAGPIGVVTMGNDMVAASPTLIETVLRFLVFFVIMNVGVAGLNLLPLYPSDGGRVAMLALEKMFGQKAEPLLRVFKIVSAALFLMLIIGVIAMDFVRLFS